MRIYLKGKEEEEEAFNHSTHTYEGRTAYVEIPFHFPVDICLSFQFLRYQDFIQLRCRRKRNLESSVHSVSFFSHSAFLFRVYAKPYRACFFLPYGGRGMEGHVPWNMPGDFLQHKSPEEDVPAKGRLPAFLFPPLLPACFGCNLCLGRAATLGCCSSSSSFHISPHSSS